MIDLEKVEKLAEPLRFIYSKGDEPYRIGITILEEKRDRSARRWHHFSLEDGIYQGYTDENASQNDTEPELKIGGLEISYKRQNIKGQNVYNVRRYLGGRKIGNTTTTKEHSLPRLELGEGNSVSLINGTKLEHIEGQQTELERLRDYADSQGRSIAEVTATDNYLDDTTQERRDREEQARNRAEQEGHPPIY